MSALAIDYPPPSLYQKVQASKFTANDRLFLDRAIVGIRSSAPCSTVYSLDGKKHCTFKKTLEKADGPRTTAVSAAAQQ